MPPVATIVAEPSFPPLHDTAFVLFVAKRAFGSLIVIDWTASQFVASVTVTVYVPAAKSVSVAAFPPLDHA